MLTKNVWQVASTLFIYCFLCLPSFSLGALAGAKETQPGEQDVVAFHYPPYMIDGPTNERQGLEIDILKAALGKQSSKFRYKFYPIPRAAQAVRYSRLNNHPIYVGTSLHFNDEIKRGDVFAVCIGRAKFVAFTFGRSPVAKIKDLTIEKLKPFRIAALRGSSINARLKQAGIQALEARTFEQLFTVLEQDKVDVSIVLDMAGEEELKKVPLQLRKKITTLPASLFEIPLAIVIAKEHPQSLELYTHIKNRLQEMRQDGELRKLAEKYYGRGQVPSDFFCK